MKKAASRWEETRGSCCAQKKNKKGKKVTTRSATREAKRSYPPQCESKEEEMRGMKEAASSWEEARASCS